MFEKDEVKKEYNAAASGHHEEYKKVMWASKESMLNRFRLALEQINFEDCKRWLDVGCGTGEFQRLVLESFPEIDAFAIDICEELICFAKNKLKGEDVKLKLVDFMEFKDGVFDIITCIGVLQKTSFSPQDFFKKSTELLLPGGKIFLDTKNIDWKEFNKPGVEPDKSYISFSPENLLESAKKAGLTVLKIAGFLPEEKKVVVSEKSRTIFMVCEKPNP